MRQILFVILAFALLGGTPAAAMVFDHDEHNTYVEITPCTTCHVEGAFSIVPDRSVCATCHDDDFAAEVEYPALKTHTPLWAFNHRAAAKRSGECAACHQQDFCLECHASGFADEQGDFGNNLANVHRGDFQVSHPIAARTDPQLCSSCHEERFCSDCHDSFNRNDLAFDSHRRGFTSGTLDGRHAFFDDSQCQGCHVDSVLPSHSWSGQHAREARKNLATCQACHPDGDVCLSCHSARSGLGINPHPDNWGKIGSNLDRASGGRTCKKCH